MRRLRVTRRHVPLDRSDGYFDVFDTPRQWEEAT